MSLSWYKQDTDAGGSDYLSVALWDYKTRPYYAEGGSTYQPGAPVADGGNTSNWGMNNNWRAIADAIIANYNARVTNANGISVNVSAISALNARVVILEASPAVAVWGNITGTLSNQTDLQAALDAKTDTGHTHADYLEIDGSVAMTGALNMGANNIDNVARITPETIRLASYLIIDVDSGESIDEIGALVTADASKLVTSAGIKTYVDNSVSGLSGGGADDPIFQAGGFDYPTSNPAPLDVINSATITNVKLLGQAFDDTTNQTVEQQFRVPGDIDTSGTVTFKCVGIAETAATANIEYRLSHSVSNDNEDADVAYTHEDSGAKAVNTTQDKNTYFEWTETVANLGWAASDMCKIQWTRLASGGNDTLTDKFYGRSLEIVIPRS